MPRRRRHCRRHRPRDRSRRSAAAPGRGPAAGVASAPGPVLSSPAGLEMPAGIHDNRKGPFVFGGLPGSALARPMPFDGSRMSGTNFLPPDLPLPKSWRRDAVTRRHDEFRDLLALALAVAAARRGRDAAAGRDDELDLLAAGLGGVRPESGCLAGQHNKLLQLLLFLENRVGRGAGGLDDELAELCWRRSRTGSRRRRWR